MAVRTRKAFGATITVISTNVSYHTFDKWKLSITNSDYIGDPAMETNYLEVPGRDGNIDYSEALTGRPVFKSRPITMQMAAVKERLRWNSIVSEIRNCIHGRLVKVSFDDDKSHYWKGRIYVTGFDRDVKLGSFTLEMPDAEPYKYDLCSSQEDWLWDPFDFETDVIRYIGTLTIDSSYVLTIPAGAMLTVPVINVTSITSDTLTVRSNSNNKTYTLSQGRNRFPDLLVCGSRDVNLTFTGSGTVKVDYRGGSL